jgi:DNA invertase Pin-like site-specific DNA recombinase
MEVIGYLRVSTAEQAANGHGLDAQRAAIAREAEHRGWDVQWVEDRGVSGTRDDRLGLAFALDQLNQGAAKALVVAKLDRLGRRAASLTMVIEHARERGWAIVALDMGIDSNTASGRLVLQVLSAIAEWEGDQIRERTKAGLAAAKAKGIVPGPKSPLPESVARRIRESSAAGLRVAAIAAELNASAVPLPSGVAGRWRSGQVRRVIAREQRAVIGLLARQYDPTWN